MKVAKAIQPEWWVQGQGVNGRLKRNKSGLWSEQEEGRESLSRLRLRPEITGYHPNGQPAYNKLDWGKKNYKTKTAVPICIIH